MHLYAPQPAEKGITRRTCPDCDQRAAMIQFYTPYYGWDSTCIKCGRNWQDGHWMPLPFMRQARKKSIDNAKRRYRSILTQ